MWYIWIYQFIYRWSFLFAWFLLLTAIRKLVRIRLVWFVFWVWLFTLFVRARRRETRSVHIDEHLIETWFTKDLVLISDLHLWVYKWSTYLNKVVNEINNIQNIDAVMIAWDLTYHPLKKDAASLEQLFSPLSKIDKPVFAVLWNHDVEHPWPILRKELIQALNANGVIFLHNDIYDFTWVTLVWLWPTMSWEDETSLLSQCTDDDSVIVLAHNPDVTLSYGNRLPDLTIVWHTHCGQIRLPFIHDIIRPYFYPVRWDFDCWEYEDDNLFISKWIWEVWLPMRFRNPPTIDVLRLR